MSKRLLQFTIFFSAFIPVLAGGYGVLTGQCVFSQDIVDYDSIYQNDFAYNHIRYLSGLLLAIGLSFWSFIPAIETKATQIRLLTAIVFIGGLARLYGVLLAGEWNTSILFALKMELLVTPLICLWQTKVSRTSGDA